MYTVKKKMTIAAGHHLELPYESKCSGRHGHNWIIEVEVVAGILTDYGMVVDFTRISEVVNQLDHKYLNRIFKFNPTAENIAKWVFDEVKENLGNPYAEVSKVAVQESEGNIACFTP